jgi:hypothetical protein
MRRFTQEPRMNPWIPTTTLVGLLLLTGCQSLSGNGPLADRKTPNAEITEAYHQLSGSQRKTPPPNSTRDDLAVSRLKQASATTPMLPPTSAFERTSVTELLNQGHLAAQQGNFEQSRAAYRRVLQLHPDHPMAHHRLAIIADKKSDFRAADFHYESALRRKPDNADLLCDRGYSYFLQGRYEECERTFRTALEYQPDHGYALNNLGLLYATRGDHETALALFRRTSPEHEAQAKLARLMPNGLAPQLAGRPPVLSSDSAGRQAEALADRFEGRTAAAIADRTAHHSAVGGRLETHRVATPGLISPQHARSPQQPVFAATDSQSLETHHRSIDSGIGLPPDRLNSSADLAHLRAHSQPDQNLSGLFAQIDEREYRAQDRQLPRTFRGGTSSAPPSLPGGAPPNLPGNGHLEYSRTVAPPSTMPVHKTDSLSGLATWPPLESPASSRVPSTNGQKIPRNAGANPTNAAPSGNWLTPAGGFSAPEASHYRSNRNVPGNGHHSRGGTSWPGSSSYGPQSMGGGGLQGSTSASHHSDDAIRAASIGLEIGPSSLFPVLDGRCGTSSRNQDLHARLSAQGRVPAHRGIPRQGALSREAGDRSAPGVNSTAVSNWDQQSNAKAQLQNQYAKLMRHRDVRMSDANRNAASGQQLAPTFGTGHHVVPAGYNGGSPQHTPAGSQTPAVEGLGSQNAVRPSVSMQYGPAPSQR